MYVRVILLLGLALWTQVATGQVSFGSTQLIDDDWRFILRDDSNARELEYDDGAWERITLPHDWSVKQPLRAELASCTGYLPGGIGWYRKVLRVPSERGREKVFLYFEGVYNHSEVYLNGHLLGKRPNGYISFLYDATPYVRFDQENILAVRVDHSRSADSRWYTGSGIYRDVYLIRAGALHLTPWGLVVEPQNVSAQSARVRVSAELQNETATPTQVTVRHTLLAADGREIAAVTRQVSVAAEANASDEAALEVQHPRCWSLADPYLYSVRTTISVNGRRVDEAVTRTGIRALGFDANTGFTLNGTSLKLKGVCIHHDAGVLGAAVPPEVWRMRLQTLKSIGCNAVRFSHNPQAPVLYDLCDELGLLVLDEAFDEWEYPKRKWLRGWNVGTPGYEGSYEFFDAWSDRDLADMVRRDRNHPSVFAWSIGNEIDYPNDPYSHPVLDRARINQPMLPGYKPDRPDARRMGPIAHRLAAVVKRYDRSRPVTAALAGVVMSNATEYPAALDIVGYNYTEDRYAMDHAEYPHRILYGSENGHGLKAWRAVTDNSYIFGQFLWTGIDYLGEAGAWPSRGSTSGLLDLTGAVKPRGQFRAALWCDRPVVFLGTEIAAEKRRGEGDPQPLWTYESGASVRVVCYTNGAKAQLMLNGKPMGAAQAHEGDTGAISWVVPFQPGKLEVIALDQRGSEMGRAALQTSGAVAAMQLRRENPNVTRDGGVALVSLQLVDQNGTPVLNDDREVTCRIDGPARLLGLEAGNNRDVSDYTDATQRVYHGRIVAYVQRTTGAAGDVRVIFNAPGLPAAAVLLTANGR